MDPFGDDLHRETGPHLVLVFDIRNSLNKHARVKGISDYYQDEEKFLSVTCLKLISQLYMACEITVVI